MSSLWTMSLRWNWLVSGNDSRERERGSGAMGAQTPPPPGISDIYSFQGFIGPAPYFQGFIWPIFQGFTFIGPNLFWALPPHLPGKNIFLTPPLDKVSYTPRPMGGRDSPDAISLRHADTSLPDLLGRPSLRHAVRVSAMGG